MEKVLLRVSEAAKITSISLTKAYELVNSGAWPSLRIPGRGRDIRIPLDGLMQWIADQTNSQYVADQVKTSKIARNIN